MEKLYTLDELSEILKVSRLTLTRWEKKGKLKVIRINGTIRIRQSEIDRLMKGE